MFFTIYDARTQDLLHLLFVEKSINLQEIPYLYHVINDMQP